jgi:DNA-binding CsgD family transcriptional regulator
MSLRAAPRLHGEGSSCSRHWWRKWPKSQADLKFKPACSNYVSSVSVLNGRAEPSAPRHTWLVSLRGLVSLLDGYARLTPREREVALLLIQGCSNREIAERLVISCGTAANHVASVLNKLGCHSRAQLLSATFRLLEDWLASGQRDLPD